MNFIQFQDFCEKAYRQQTWMASNSKKVKVEHFKALRESFEIIEKEYSEFPNKKKEMAAIFATVFKVEVSKI